MDNKQESFIYNPQPQTPPDNQVQNISNYQQEISTQNSFLQNTNKPLNVIPNQENYNQNDVNLNNQGFNPIQINNSQNINPINSQNNINNNLNTNIISNLNNNINQNINLNDGLNNSINNNLNINNINMNTNNIQNNLNNIAVNQDNNRSNFNKVFSNQISSKKDTISEEDYKMINPQPDNKYINNNFDTSSTTITNLNVDPNTVRIDYSNDPKVQVNLERDKKRKNTITITAEMKVFLLIVAVLFVFIFVMPYIFDAIRNTG